MAKQVRSKKKVVLSPRYFGLPGIPETTLLTIRVAIPVQRVVELMHKVTVNKEARKAFKVDPKRKFTQVELLEKIRTMQLLLPPVYYLYDFLEGKTDEQLIAIMVDSLKQYNTASDATAPGL